MSTDGPFKVLPPSDDLPAVILSGIVPVCPAYTKLIDHIRAGTYTQRISVANLAASGYVALLQVRRILLARHPSLPIADRICNELQKAIFRAYWLSFQISQIFRQGVSYPHEDAAGHAGVPRVYGRTAPDTEGIEAGTGCEDCSAKEKREAAL